MYNTITLKSERRKMETVILGIMVIGVVLHLVRIRSGSRGTWQHNALVF